MHLQYITYSKVRINPIGIINYKFIVSNKRNGQFITSFHWERRLYEIKSN